MSAVATDTFWTVRDLVEKIESVSERIERLREADSPESAVKIAIASEGKSREDQAI